ncbi:uncharacterized protein LOC144450510 [Glandiceps talaboti]
MGSTSSKFRKALQNGEEYVAMQLYMNSPELRKSLDPNLSYGDNYNHDTPLHCVSRHGMKSLLRLFLKDLSGNPNKKNARNETSIHSVCLCNTAYDPAIMSKRAECLYMILQWEGAILRNGERERAEIDAIDEKGNTALHYAAQSGLKPSVELLVANNSKLFVENKEKLTPCDVAEKSNNLSIALYLESKMVFSTEAAESVLEQEISFIEPEEPYTGLRPQDLQEAKDQLLVETSDMLRVPLFTAEALLRNHEWSRENLLESWMRDPVACCDKAGVKPPSDIAIDNSVLGRRLQMSEDDYICQEDTVCDICADNISKTEDPVDMPCNHQFCRVCWESYLTGKIQEGCAHNIRCPAFDCTKLVPIETIENLVSRDMARRYLQFDIKAFVDSNPHIKWCPAPGCGRAVKYPEGEHPSRGSASNYTAPPPTSKSVDCGNGHFYCWNCLGEAHEPCSCENLRVWHEKIAEIKPEELTNTSKDSESAANILWLVTNSKPCPKCNSPIQKNEGCNHMKCTKCKHDFCWVCLEPWNKHGSATGGYFRCNRYEAVHKADEKSGSVVKEAEEKNKKMQELNKFVHYYTRYKNHENSFKLEQPLIRSAKEKMLILAKAVTDTANASSETQFIEDAINELLKARRVLKFSYAYGYYLEDDGRTKTIFEFMQTELEEATETLSQMVARPYLRTPRYKIIQSAQLVQRKRHEFLSAVSKGLIPPEETPPLLRRKQFARKNIFNFENNDDDGDALRQAIAASLQEMPPGGDGWMMDKTGRHNNIPLLYEYLGFDSEESDDTSPISMTDQGLELKEPDTPSSPDSSDSTLCFKPGCGKPRAKNKRSTVAHEYCGLKCMRQDKLSRMESDSPPYCEDENTINNEQIDLLRALEMSRLLLMEQAQQLDNGCDSSEASASDVNSLQLPALVQKLSSPRIRKRLSSFGKREDSSPQAVSPSTHSVRSIESGESVQPNPNSEEVELQRALELSCQSLKDGKTPETDLEHAIRLSLQATEDDNLDTKIDSNQRSPSANSRLLSNDDMNELLQASAVCSVLEINKPHMSTVTEAKCNASKVQYFSEKESSDTRQEKSFNGKHTVCDNDLDIPQVKVIAPLAVSETDTDDKDMLLSTPEEISARVYVSEEASSIAHCQSLANAQSRARDHSPLRRTCSGSDQRKVTEILPDLLCPPSAHARVYRSHSAPEEGVAAKSVPNSPGLLRNRRVGSSPSERDFLDPRDSPHMWDSVYLDYRVCHSSRGSPRCQRYTSGINTKQMEANDETESTSKEIWEKNVDSIWQKKATHFQEQKVRSQASSPNSAAQTLEKAFEQVHFPTKYSTQFESKPKSSQGIPVEYKEKNYSSNARKNRHSVYSSSPSRTGTLEVKESRRCRSVSPAPRNVSQQKGPISVNPQGLEEGATAVVRQKSTEKRSGDKTTVVSKEKSDRERRRRRERRSRRKEKEEEVGWQMEEWQY